MTMDDFVKKYLDNLKQTGEKGWEDHNLVLSSVDLQEFNEDVILGTINYGRLYKGDKNINGWKDILEDFRHQFKLAENHEYALL